jgi:hypothetical protein
MPPKSRRRVEAPPPPSTSTESSDDDETQDEATTDNDDDLISVVSGTTLAPSEAASEMPSESELEEIAAATGIGRRPRVHFEDERPELLIDIRDMDDSKWVGTALCHVDGHIIEPVIRRAFPGPSKYAEAIFQQDPEYAALLNLPFDNENWLTRTMLDAVLKDIRYRPIQAWKLYPGEKLEVVRKWHSEYVQLLALMASMRAQDLKREQDRHPHGYSASHKIDDDRARRLGVPRRQ